MKCRRRVSASKLLRDALTRRFCRSIAKSCWAPTREGQIQAALVVERMMESEGFRNMIPYKSMQAMVRVEGEVAMFVRPWTS